MLHWQIWARWITIFDCVHLFFSFLFVQQVFGFYMKFKKKWNPSKGACCVLLEFWQTLASLTDIPHISCNIFLELFLLFFFFYLIDDLFSDVFSCVTGVSVHDDLRRNRWKCDFLRKRRVRCKTTCFFWYHYALIMYTIVQNNGNSPCLMQVAMVTVQLTNNDLKRKWHCAGVNTYWQ